MALRMLATTKVSKNHTLQQEKNQYGSIVSVLYAKLVLGVRSSNLGPSFFTCPSPMPRHLLRQWRDIFQGAHVLQAREHSPCVKRLSGLQGEEKRIVGRQIFGPLSLIAGPQLRSFLCIRFFTCEEKDYLNDQVVYV